MGGQGLGPVHGERCQVIRAAMVCVLLLLLYCVACDGGAPVGSSSVSLIAEAPAAVLPAPSTSEIPSGATTPASANSDPPCPPPLRVAPRTLAVSWPSYVGRVVSFACRAIRRVDFLRTVIVADGARFVVTGAPDATPCGSRTSTFAVVGCSSVPLGGRGVLPELLLVDGGDCTP